MKNNFFNSKNFLFRKDQNKNTRIQSAETECIPTAHVNHEQNFKNPTSSTVDNLQKHKAYDDEQILDENVLKEMAQAYATVLHKYGYSMKHPNVSDFEKPESATNISSPPPINFQRSLNQKTPLKNKTEIAREATPISSQPQQTIPPMGTFESNLDLLSQNLLTTPTIDYMNNQALIFTYFQTSNNLLQQILSELKVITCLIEYNRRRRLS